MADKIVESQTISFSLDFARGQDTESRNISFDAYNIDEENIKEDVGKFRALLLGEFNKFLQPTGWRDSNTAEEEWTTNAVRVKFISKIETEFSYPE